MFGRRRKRGRHSANRGTAHTEAEFDGLEEGGDGPFDEPQAPNDGLNRLDLGSIRLPVPEGAQLQVEMDPAGQVRAVHLLTTVGQLTVSAFAAPKTDRLWPEVSGEMIAQFKSDGFRILRENGEWGEEIAARNNEVHLRVVGVDGPRWMLRGIAAAPTEEQAVRAAEALYELVRDTVVVRGPQPMPVRTPLPIELPEAIARHIQQQQQPG
ncbi:DUF3710 domain-containing protein [Saccharothrix longispora]|uniref:DUF3710 domain-containing protein n=1 Tax=Saccharothrix longispora TaxID=33920 RepID=A0ABU1Q811_9PSEU|nr:DUF3710 domain-containing protein [Saccharothrix longispora]MBY8852278.1 DUF3710 domain-containing protein [Saccharothrix sp. MB29]MDR6599006.1 hypothetical protein [Saccharothrix longispora]MDU0290181.1 DUF3710 domain-containing protein [Saccharothrix longispora]